jgi:hypothetical protein
MVTIPAATETNRGTGRPDPGLTGAPIRLTVGLAAAALVTSVGTFFTTGILTGPAAMNGSARGTALVILVVAVPVLLGSMAMAVRGSQRAVLGWLGATGYLLYNAVMFLFGTPFNPLFLAYVAMLSLSLWTVVALLRGIDVDRLGRYLSGNVPARAVAAYLLAVAVLNTAAWLVAVVPATLADEPMALLDGTGLTTNPVYVQDLAFWLPLLALTGWRLWRRTADAYTIAGSLLVMYVIEAIGVATDQWFGHAADPASTVVSGGAVWVFAAMAVIGLVPLIPFLRAGRAGRAG